MIRRYRTHGRSVNVSDEQMSFWILSLLQRGGITKDELASFCNISRQSLNGVIKTGRPSGPLLRLLDLAAEACDIARHDSFYAFSINEVAGSSLGRNDNGQKENQS